MPAPSPIERRGAADVYAGQVRLLVVLVLSFAVLPGALLVSVGILVLVFGHQAHDIVFGVLTISLAATLIAGITFVFLYVRRTTSLAKLQAEFVQKVSHDLRTPLTSIRMFVETLQDGRLTDQGKIRECLEVLSAETLRLTAMVERLLKWASMEAGKRVYRLERVRTAGVIEQAIAGFERQVKLLELDGKVELERQIADSLPDVYADADAMSEALLNVLQNALRHTVVGKKRELRVRAVKRDALVVISIADNGPGIPKHEQRRIFEKFYRVVDPANPNVEGSGLGLAIVHHIVRAHRGSIEVESDVGHGATFHIQLPAAEAR
jgi:two-component system phosphate regulon sensor histidine kinase PhoR